jgi:uncharacterized protein (TIGR02246 family)
MKRKISGFLLVVLAGVTATVAFRTVSQPAEAQTKNGSPPESNAIQKSSGKADGAEEGIKKITAEYEKAFNAADAKAAAALWTENGEYMGDDGEVQAGREAIEKSLAKFFKENPKATVEVQIEKVRVIGRGTAHVDGLVRLKLPGDEMPEESQYTALHVLEDGAWRAASVREWVPDPATNVTLKSMEWLIGDWAAKGDAGEVKITYTWDENKTFINGKYTITKDGKTVSSGMQILGRNPEGGLRSWAFDSSGITNEGLWAKDGTRWVSEVTAVLPNASEMTSLNIIVTLGPDAFTWQTTDRAVNGVPLPALPPIKVTRVKK